jgi:hypothetical protein
MRGRPLRLLPATGEPETSHRQSGKVLAASRATLQLHTIRAVQQRRKAPVPCDTSMDGVLA